MLYTVPACNSFTELAGMRLVVGEYNGNATDAVRRYREL
jgi:hypothetical protein